MTTEIIGIVQSVKHNTLTEEALPTFYSPMTQIPKPVSGFLANNFSMVVRTSMDAQTVAESVRRELRTIDSDVAISTSKTARANRHSVWSHRAGSISCSSRRSPELLCCWPVSEFMG